MQIEVVPILLFAACSTALGVGLLLLGRMVGPHREAAVKQMPYESGMDPIHDTRRRFDVRFHLIAIAFLVFDVEILFLYPWAVATKRPEAAAATQVADEQAAAVTAKAPASTEVSVSAIPPAAVTSV